MSRREQLVDDAAEVAALLQQPDDTEDAQLVDELGDVPDDDSPTPTREQVRVAALLCAHATSGTDLDDLAGVLGVRHAVEPAERWLNGRLLVEDDDAVLAAGPQPCEVCGLNVTAQKIAETGRARHPWHPED